MPVPVSTLIRLCSVPFFQPLTCKEAAQSGKRQYPEIIEIKDDEDKRGNGKWKNNTFRKNQPRLGPADREVIEITDSEDDSENHDTTDISQQTRRLNPAKSTVSGTKNTDPSTHPKRDHPDLNNQRNHNLVDQLNRGPLLPDPNPDMNNDPGLDNSLRVDGRALAHPCDPQPQPLEDIESDDGAILDNDDHTVVTPTHTSNAQLPEEWEIGIGELVVSAILDIIPSVDLDELARVVEAHLINHGPDNIVEILIDQLLDGAEAAHHVDQLLEDVPAGNHDDRQSVECACCFDETPVTFCIQCPEGHHFCRRCITHYASRELGSQNTRLTCMDTGGCHAVFTSAGLANILSPTLLALFHRLELRRDLKEARLEGLEECPFCDWACIIEIPKDECIFFWCRNEEDCGVISCRLCRQKSHISFTCEEAETNKRVAGTHAIEEAMTEALKRHCPKCREGAHPSSRAIHSDSDH